MIADRQSRLSTFDHRQIVANVSDREIKCHRYAVESPLAKAMTYHQMSGLEILIGLCLSELSDDKTFDATQCSVEVEVIEHTLGAIDGFRDILDE